MIDLSNELAIGIDIGGTNTKYGLDNHKGQILEQGELKTEAYPDVKDYVNALYDAIAPILEKNDGKTLKGVVIVAPNGNPFRGTIEYDPNLICKRVIRMSD